MHYIFVVQKEGINGIIKIKWSLQEKIENEAKNSKNTLVLSGLWSDGTGGIKGAKMGITQMAQRIKQIHPDYVLIFKVR